jgi:hypothetical protein
MSEIFSYILICKINGIKHKSFYKTHIERQKAFKDDKYNDYLTDIRMINNYKVINKFKKAV